MKQLTLKIRVAKHNILTFVVVQERPATEPMTAQSATPVIPRTIVPEMLPCVGMMGLIGERR